MAFVFESSFNLLNMTIFNYIHFPVNDITSLLFMFEKSPLCIYTTILCLSFARHLGWLHNLSAMNRAEINNDM